ncbi:MAG: 50S ribosomal protein L9 [Treponema sp.]|nr:50S ribosomal protein L9 [Treponema sp.]
MKVILNVDVKSLGEEGDVKNVANGYARNFLLPRNLAVPYNEATVLMFEARKAEIEARKEQKRKDSASLKDKLEAATVEVVMPAGANGKLYGAVSAHVIADALTKLGFDIERKRIELSGAAIKSVGTYKVIIKLYEAQTAEIHVVVKAQNIEAPAEEKPAKGKKEKAEKPAEKPAEEAAPAPAAEEPAQEAAPAAEPAAETEEKAE